MGIEVLISSLVANLITKYAKPTSPASFSDEDIQARKDVIRGMNALVGLAMLVGTSWFLGSPLDVSSIESAVNTVVTVAVTFFASQGQYLLGKA